MWEISVKELVRARARDDVNTMLAAFRHRILRDARHTRNEPGLDPHHAVHPDVLNTQLDALIHDPIGDFRVGEDEDGVWLFRDGLQVRVAWCAVILGYPRIYGSDGVAGVLEPFVRRVAARIAPVGDPDDSDGFLGKKVLYERVDVRHMSSLPSLDFFQQDSMNCATPIDPGS